MRTNRRVFVWALGLGFLAASAAFAAGREVALGAAGEIYTVRTGSYGELFPKGKAFAAANPVVALDITKPESPLQRILVPGTGGSEVEKSPSVLFEDDSETVFLLWESAQNVHPILQLARFDGTSWSKPLEVIGNPFAPKTSPQFAITRDAYEEPEPGGTALSRHRTVLHLLWQEETASGAWATLYSPILINDGGYTGWNPVYDLDEYLQASVTSTAAAVQPSLARAPLIETGRDERTLVIAYASTATGSLAVVEVDVLPEQLTQLADAARQRILDLGRQYYPSDLAALGDKARQHIVDLGRAFRPEVVQAIANQIKAQIVAGGAGGLEALADKARQHIVDLGAQFSGRGLRGANGADATAKLMETALAPDLQGSPGPVGSLLFQLRALSSLPAPAVGAGTVRLFISKTGEEVIVSWAQADKVLYRNSREGGWSEAKELQLSNGLSLAKAYEILEQRVRNR